MNIVRIDNRQPPPVRANGRSGYASPRIFFPSGDNFLIRQTEYSLPVRANGRSGSRTPPDGVLVHWLPLSLGVVDRDISPQGPQPRLSPQHHRPIPAPPAR